MFVREGTLRVKVAEGHVQYLRKILEWTDILFAGVALRGVRFDKSELYNDMTHERLFELLDSATHLVFDICDGDASCLWPTRLGPLG